MRGTERLPYQELRDEIDRLGVRLNVAGELGKLNASIVGERANLGPAIELLGEILKTPAMPEEEFAIIKKDELAKRSIDIPIRGLRETREVFALPKHRDEPELDG